MIDLRGFTNWYIVKLIKLIIVMCYIYTKLNVIYTIKEKNIVSVDKIVKLPYNKNTKAKQKAIDMLNKQTISTAETN